MHRRLPCIFFILAFFLALPSCTPSEISLATAPVNQKADRDEAKALGQDISRRQATINPNLLGSFGTYNAPPRHQNGRVDTALLAEELAELGANTYNFLIWQNRHDWEDLQLFLPLAREKNILVWVTIFPPSECFPNTTRYSEPFRLDYDRWAAEIASLSLIWPNLVAWSIDDFSVNLNFFTPEKTKQLIAIAMDINDRLAFVPCCYYRQIIAPDFASNYIPLLDGILFPYLNASDKENLTNHDRVGFEVANIRKATDNRVPIILDVYASPHTGLPPSTPQYIQMVMEEGRQNADGVHVYRHQDKKKEPEKHKIIKQLFQHWKER